jgi:hypothetical protein
MAAPPTTTTMTGTTSTKHEHHQTQWFAIMAFSIIALAALITNFDDDTNVGDQAKEIKWVVAAISIAFSVSTISVLAHLVIPDKFTNTNLETGMVGTICCKPSFPYPI